MKRDGFVDVFPVPDDPVETTPTGGWERVERSLSTHLPADYKWFIETYGTGCISEFVWVFNPFSDNPNLNLLDRVPDLAQDYARMCEGTGEDPPYPFHPDPGGLVPAGITDNGDVLYWLSEEDPDDWPMVVAAWRSDRVERHATTLTGLLLAFVTYELDSEILSGDYVEDTDQQFVPLKP